MDVEMTGVLSELDNISLAKKGAKDFSLLLPGFGESLVRQHNTPHGGSPQVGMHMPEVLLLSR